LHFFDKELGKEIYPIIQKKQYEFNEVFEKIYNNEEDPSEAHMYKYMRDESYLNYLLTGYDKKYINDKRNLAKDKKGDDDEDDEESEDIDDDGFTIIKKKK